MSNKDSFQRRADIIRNLNRNYKFLNCPKFVKKNMKIFFYL